MSSAIAKQDFAAKSAKRFNSGKLRLGLIPPMPLKYLAEVYTKGAHKYTLYEDSEGRQIKGADITMDQAKGMRILEDGADNWRLGQPWLNSLESVERHLLQWKLGEDNDPELNTKHLANAAWGMFALMEYERTHPEFDNRRHSWRTPKRIALDIDGVLADFDGGFKARYNIAVESHHWYFTYEVQKRWNEIRTDAEFWLNLPPLFPGKDLPFEPVCYITHREIASEVTMLWLESHGFPCVPVHTVKGSKLSCIKEQNIDVFVDDKPENFLELSRAGVMTYLYDQPYNRHLDVGFRRIKSLKELI